MRDHGFFLWRCVGGRGRDGIRRFFLRRRDKYAYPPVAIIKGFIGVFEIPVGEAAYLGHLVLTNPILLKDPSGHICPVGTEFPVGVVGIHIWPGVGVPFDHDLVLEAAHL